MNRAPDDAPDRVNLFVIGASKCGTTYLYGLLQQHPDIQMCPEKEPRFFQAEDCLANLPRYQALYASLGGARYYGEASPNYSETTYFTSVARNIHSYNPDARIVYLVRDPLARLASVWAQAQSTGHWAKSGAYGAAMPLDYERAITEYPPFLEATRYWTHLSNYLALFPKEQVHVLMFEDLIADTPLAMGKLFRFLGLPEVGSLDPQGVEKNARNAKVMYSPWAGRMGKLVPRSLLRLAPEPARRWSGRMLANLLEKPLLPPVLDEGAQARIKAELADEVLSLYHYLGEQGDPWSYRSIAGTV